MHLIKPEGIVNAKNHHGLVVFLIVLCRCDVHTGTIFVTEVCGGHAPQLRAKACLKIEPRAR